MFAPYINSIKTLFIVPTDAHYYKTLEMLKQFKVTILAPTCFGSRRNHDQGAVLCLAKTTKWFFCACRYRRSQCCGGISACCAGVRNRTPAQQADMLIYSVHQLEQQADMLIYSVHQLEQQADMLIYSVHQLEQYIVL
jgi:hypothetical protein